MATIDGSPNPDILTGTAEGDHISGFAGDDHISGLAGWDFINGGEGNDTINGGDSSDGSDEIDFVSYQDSPDGVHVNLADDIAYDDGWGDSDVLLGIEGVDDSAHDDTIIGNAGNNWINLFHGGTDDVDAGDGFDLLLQDQAPGPVIINLHEGWSIDGHGNTDTTLNFEAAHGGAFGDHITLTNGDGYAFGRAGDDTILGLDGSDNLIGGSGNDILDGGDGAFDNIDYFDDGFEFNGPAPATHGANVNLETGIAIDGWGDIDTISNVEGVSGSQFDDVIMGNMDAPLGNFLAGHDGNDVIHNGGTAGFAFDSVDGGAGNDILTVLGGGNIFGGAGDDTIRAQYHGDDRDFVFAAYQFDPDGIVANLTASSNGGLAGGNNDDGFFIADGYGGTDNVAGIHALFGSHSDDLIFVDSTFQNSYGSMIEVRPGGGDDAVVFDGVDIARISYRNDQGPVYGDMETGIAHDLDTANSFIGSDTFSGATQFRGSQHADEIYGALGDDQGLRGEGGDDLIDGRSGDDLVQGENGNDTLRGGLGNDRVEGGNGNDTIIDNGTEGGGVDPTGPGKGLGHLKDNGKGHEKHEGSDVPGHDKHHGGDLLEDNDVYTGGGGHDTFVFLANNGHDVISDFTAGAGTPDVIDLSGWSLADFGALLALADDQGGTADVVFTLDQDNSLTLNELRIADLHANDFLLA